MSSEVPIEIEDKPTSVTIMRELVEHLQGTIEALKREIVSNPKSDEYRKARKGTGERLTVAKHRIRREDRSSIVVSNPLADLGRGESSYVINSSPSL